MGQFVPTHTHQSPDLLFYPSHLSGAIEGRVIVLHRDSQPTGAQPRINDHSDLCGLQKQTGPRHLFLVISDSKKKHFLAQAVLSLTRFSYDIYALSDL